MDEEEIYKDFLTALKKEKDLPSDDEEFLATEEVAEENYRFKVSKAELVDLVKESKVQPKPLPKMYKPVLPMYNPKLPNRCVYMSKQQRFMVLRQMEMFVQLLAQEILLTEDSSYKQVLAKLLGDLLKRCEGSEEFDVSFLVNGKQKVRLSRQVSLLHVPLIDVLKQCLTLNKLVSTKMRRKDVKENLSLFAPAFVSKQLLPVENPVSTRRYKNGFSLQDDFVLLQALTSTKCPSTIHELFLPQKSPHQIKVRIKNLKSKKYIASNEVQDRIKKLLMAPKKDWEQEELQQLRRGVQWLGLNKLHLIQKYFLPHRNVKDLSNMSRQQLYTPQNFTQENLNDCDACNCSCQCQKVFEVYFLQ